jgi:putative CocE/NonD family hydrolase
MKTIAVLTLLAGLAAAAGPYPAAYPPTNDIKLDNLVAMPMRDGVKLYADVYRPVAAGKYPVILSRTPYSTERAPSAYEAGVFFARRGYVYVFQDVRGRHESEGKWEPFRNDIEDGYDSVEWAAKQPWSNGKVCMQGGSYLGHVQWRAAMAKPPSLTCMFPAVAATSLYHDWMTLNGGWRLSFNFGWGPVRQESRIMQNTGAHGVAGLDDIHFDKMQWHLPLLTMQELAGRNAQFWRDWIAHPDYDAYWKKLNAEEVFQEMDVPVHTQGGWFDIFVQGTIRGYMGMATKSKSERSRRGARMLVGPWGHGPSRKFGEIDFGENANVSLHDAELRFFDYWLKGIDNGYSSEPPVTVFVMGRNEWRREQAYPLPQTQYRKMYLASGGKANTSYGDGRLTWDAPPAKSEPDKYTYDPANPVPSLGGNNCCGTPTIAGPVDQRRVEARGDVLVYTSPVIEEPLEVTGPVKLVLHASTDVRDTDFIAKLVDVYPDGRAINLCEGIVRARYREGTDKPKLLESGKVYEFEIDMVGTANEFRKGHRIRVDLTSSHFPQFDRNPNTGEPFGTSAAVRVAHQTIYHDSARPSHIVLPVIPKR